MAFRKRCYHGLERQENGLRIATNLSLPAAGFSVFADYLSDVWPEAEAENRFFQEEFLQRIRIEMMETVRSQQASDIFLTGLKHLLAKLGTQDNQDLRRATRRYPERVNPLVHVSPWLCGSCCYQDRCGRRLRFHATARRQRGVDAGSQKVCPS